VIEEVEDLTEWLADQVGMWGSCPDGEKDGCYQERYCRLCWTMEVKQRMRHAVLGELQRAQAQLARGAQP
jgi:hypothetical protein